MKLILSKVCVLFAVGALSLDVCATRGGRRQRKKKDAAQQQQAPACTPIPQQSVHSAPDGGGAASAREESDNVGQAGARGAVPSMETVYRQLRADMRDGFDATPVRDTLPGRKDKAARRRLIRESLALMKYRKDEDFHLVNSKVPMLRGDRREHEARLRRHYMVLHGGSKK